MMTARVMQLWLVTGLVLLVFGGAVLSLSVGEVNLSIVEVITGLFGSQDDLTNIIVQEIRLPRAVLGILVGVSLGISGAALQGFLRNPLAEPGVVGVSGCAALGAVLVFYSGLSSVLILALPIGGIVGAFVGVLALYVLAGKQSSTVTLILAGVAVNAFASALTALALNLSPNPYASFEIIFWQLGSLADRSLEHVYMAGPMMVVGWVMMMRAASDLDALTLGEETAISMGVNLSATRAKVVLGTALAVGSAVAVSGVIGFVGLVVPHLLRPLVHYQASKLLLVSGLGGAVLVLCADVFVRLIPANVELKLGVLTALVGAPFFLLLLHQLRRHEIQQ